MDWDMGMARLGVYDDDGFAGTQYDGYGEGQSGVVPAETHFPYGLYGLAMAPQQDGSGNPDPTTAHQVLRGMYGGHQHTWLLENPSVIQLLPNVQPGETIFYGPLGQMIRAKVDGSFAFWLPGQGGGADITMVLGGVDTLGNPGGLTLSGPWGVFSYDTTGCHIKHASGARIDLGASGGLPGPLSSVASYINLTAGSIALDAASVTMGAGDGTAPVPNGTVLLELLTQMYAALQTIAIALQTGGTGSGVVTLPGAPAAVAAVESIPTPNPETLFANAMATVA